MGKIKIRHFVQKTSTNGKPLHYWQPAKVLREKGWAPQRLSDDLGQAVNEAKALNDKLDRWRNPQDGPAPGTDPGVEADDTKLFAQPADTPAGSNTMADLIEKYRKSRFYPTTPSTARNYEWAIAKILAWTAIAGVPGAEPLASIGRRACNDFYEKLLATGKTSAAGQTVRVLSVVLEQGVREEMIAVNPARRLGIVGGAARGVAFPRAAIRAFVQTADALGFEAIGTAIVANHWLGQRPVDIRKLPRNRYRDGIFWIYQQKTGAYIPVPDNPRVAERVEAELARQADARVSATTLIVDPDGRPYSQSLFSDHYLTVRETVAETHGSFPLDYITVDPETGADRTSVAADALQFRDLRPTAVTELAIAGCELPQIAAISGHALSSVQSIVDRYLVRSGALAGAATDRRLAWEKTLEDGQIWEKE